MIRCTDGDEGYEYIRAIVQIPLERIALAYRVVGYDRDGGDMIEDVSDDWTKQDALEAIQSMLSLDERDLKHIVFEGDELK